MLFTRFHVPTVRGVIIGETGRCLKTRMKEHIRNTKTFKKGSNIATTPLQSLH